MNYQTINALAILALVGITVYYAFQTKKLVEENRRLINMQYLERRLSCVYSPLLRVLEQSKNEILPTGGEVNKKDRVLISIEKFEEIDNIFKGYRYLMSAKLIDKLGQFVKQFNSLESYGIGGSFYDIDDIKELYDIVLEEYNQIQNSLNKLIKN